MKVVGTRTDQLDDMFGAVPFNFLRSGQPSGSVLSNPFVAISATKTEIIDRVPDLLELPDKTDVLWQWHGQWRSDYFSFKVKDFKSYIAKKQKELGI